MFSLLGSRFRSKISIEPIDILHGGGSDGSCGFEPVTGLEGLEGSFLRPTGWDGCPHPPWTAKRPMMDRKRTDRGPSAAWSGTEDGPLPKGEKTVWTGGLRSDEGVLAQVGRRVSTTSRNSHIHLDIAMRAAAARKGARAWLPSREWACKVVKARTGSVSDAGVEEGKRWKANIDYRAIRDNLQRVEENCRKRNSSADPGLVVRLYDEYTALQQQADAVRNARNENAKAMKGKLEEEKRKGLIEEGKILKEKLAQYEEDLAAVENRLQTEGRKIPNETHPDVPSGGEDASTLFREVGHKVQTDFEIKDHVQIGVGLDIVDFDTGAKVSGNKFYYMKNAGALLELALVNWALSKVVAKGYQTYTTPDLVRENVVERCGFQPRGENTQVYSVENSDLCLAGTSEILLGGVYMDEIIPETELPIRMAAFSHCFRTEAGAAGAATRGLYRVHQFSKVEMFIVCTPEQSEALHQELIEIEEELFTELGLHFKILDMSSEDLGAPAYRKFDVEAWMPGLQRYGEISSASNCTDYQSRRLNIRYRAHSKQAGKKKPPNLHVHTLNATACAVPRMIVAILENFQQVDGSVIVPEPLRPFMGGIEVLVPPS